MPQTTAGNVNLPSADLIYKGLRHSALSSVNRGGRRMSRSLRTPVLLVFALMLTVTFSGCATNHDRQPQVDRSAEQQGNVSAEQQGSTSAPTSAEAAGGGAGQPGGDNVDSDRAGDEAIPDQRNQSPDQPAKSAQPEIPDSRGIPPVAPGAPFEPPKEGPAPESPLTIPQWGQSGARFNDVKSQFEQDIRDACKGKLCLKLATEIDEDSCITKGDSEDWVVTNPPYGKLVERDSTVTFACNRAADDGQESPPQSESPQSESPSN